MDVLVQEVVILLSSVKVLVKAFELLKRIFSQFNIDPHHCNALTLRQPLLTMLILVMLDKFKVGPSLR